MNEMKRKELIFIRTANLPNRKTNSLNIQQSFQPNFKDYLPIHTTELMQNIIHNLTEAKSRHGFRYNDIAIDFAFLVYCRSPPAYNIVHQFFYALPTYITIWRHYSPIVSDIRRFLSESNLVRKYLLYLNYPYENIEFSIAIDAIYCHQWQKGDPKAQEANGKLKNAMFIFLLMPLSTNFPNIILHVEPHEIGNAAGIINTINRCIINIAHVVKVKYVITDGVRAYIQFQQEFFKFFTFSSHFDQWILLTKIYISKNVVIFILDIIHLAKNQRTRLVFLNHQLHINTTFSTSSP